MRAEKEVVKLDRSWLKYMRNISNEKDKIDLGYKLRAARKEGIIETSKTIARNLLAEGSTHEFIQKITGLDLETIKGLSSVS
ncbi:MAG: hypothetical protein FWD28_08425 [Treponema sp.]|nr:hypothetical protein [Treponema sp.]